MQKKRKERNRTRIRVGQKPKDVSINVATTPATGIQFKDTFSQVQLL